MKVRVAASVALSAAVVAGLSACMLITPQQTARSYTPSDGVNGRAGDVSIRNGLIISGDDQAGTLVGAFVNSGDSAQTVTLQYALADGSTTSTTVQVPADGLLTLGAPSAASDAGATSDQVVLDGIDAPLGGLFPVSMSVGSDIQQLQLPVLTGSLSEYATLVPTPTPTPTRTRKATPEPTESSLTESPTPDPSPSE